MPADHYTSTPPTAQQVEDALNSNHQIGTNDGGVNVTLTPDNVFRVTFKSSAHAEPILASEVLPAFFTTVSPVGTTTSSAAETQMGDSSTSTPEVQDVHLSPATDYFQLSLDGTNYSKVLPSTATVAQVQAELDKLAQAAGKGSTYFDGQGQGSVQQGPGGPGDYTSRL